MKTFFNPSSIAVVGASTRKGGYQILKNLLYGYTGAIYGVNPGHREIEGVPCYPSVEAIPYPVDLAILLVPAPVVPAVLEGCARKEIKRVMVESAGFAEVGEEGRAIQERALAVARGSGLRIWGPNCMGLVDVQRNFFFTFMSPYIYEDGLLPGRISLIAQSGMLSAGFLADLQRKRLRIGKVCSIGNKADVDECDLLEYLIDDPDTDAVALYLESLPRGRLFADLASGSTKPIVVLKGGKSEEGARAAMSHTSSLAGNSRLFDSILDMSGVTLASDFHQMIDLARALSENPPIPPPWRVAVLTFSGGAGILSCDLMARHGLRVARFSGPTKKALDELFPRWMPASNPVDLYPAMEIHGNIETYQRALAVVMEDPNVDVVFIHYVPGIDPNTLDLEILKKEADRARKKVVFWLLGRDAPTRAFQKRAEEVGLLFYDEISRALECVAAAARFQAETRPLRDFPRDSLSGFVEEAPEVIVDPSSHGSVWDEYDSKRLLERASIPVVQERLVFDPEEALAAAVSLGFPVVLKGLMPGDVHKTEHGLVRLGIDSRERLQSSFEELSAKLKEKGRILLQRQATVDYELIAGFVRDDQFGPCVMFGLGGIFSELQRDVVFAAAPLTRGEALKLIRKIKGRRLLEGFRGMAPLDENLMAEILVNLGNLGAGNPVEQIDINPLIVHKGVPLAVDATVILTKT